MRATLNRECDKSDNLCLSAESLAKMLDCGRATAVKIGTAAGAKISIGRRTLYKMDLIEKYLNQLVGA